MLRLEHLLTTGLPQRAGQAKARLMARLRQMGLRNDGSLAPTIKRWDAWVRTRAVPLLRRAWAKGKPRFPTASLVITVLILLGCAGIGVIHLQRQGERESLASELSTARSYLSKYGTEDTRNERMANAQAALAEAQDYFPDMLTSATVLERILKLAQECHVQVNEMQASPGKVQKAAMAGYVVLSVNVQAKGDLSDLQAFLDGLESGRVKAVSVDRVTIGNLDDIPLASISISAYGRQ